MMTLIIGLCNLMLNAIKWLAYFHWILIGFYMRWSKFDLRIGIRAKGNELKLLEYHVKEKILKVQQCRS